MSPPISQSVGADAAVLPQVADWLDFWALLKPRVMSLVVFTGLCGMLVAPGSIHPVIGFTAILCLAIGAGAAGALNQWYEADIDALMHRTRERPIPAGRLSAADAFGFAVALAIGSVLVMGLVVNLLAAAILLGSILFYVFIYTIWLKRRTPQNIVIGGAAGAFPPVIGWAAVTSSLDTMPLLLFALIFLWTPPHFWALSLFARADYARANIPMLPVVAGESATRRQVFLYTVPMLVVSLAPWLLGLSGAIYGIGATVLGCIFLAGSVAVLRGSGEREARLLFGYSILYLFALFSLLVADHLLGSGGVS
jgi:heme o synthase